MSKAVITLSVVAVCAGLTVLALDYAVGKLVPPVAHEYETVDGIRDYAKGDPHVLVLGSSYVRSLLPLAAWYRTQTPAFEVAVVPIEGGKLSALDWLLQHRLGPLIDAAEDAAPPRPRLRHLVLQTNYYDLCGVPEEQGNLPARAWNLLDYLLDFAANGATAFNANYVDRVWKQWMSWSILVSDRGFFRIVPYLRQQVGFGIEEAVAGRMEVRLAHWLEMIRQNDIAAESCEADGQIEALDSILSFAQLRNIETSVMLWPVIPKALTPETLAVTTRFRAFVESRAKPLGIPVFDLQEAGVLQDEDFRADLDHLIPAGDEKVSRWAEQGPIGDVYRRWAATTLGDGR